MASDRILAIGSQKDSGRCPSDPGCQPSASAPLCGGSSQSGIPNAALIDRIALSLAVECECNPARAPHYRPEAEAIVADLWQPIEAYDARRDGERVIAWWPHLGEAVVAWIAKGGLRSGSWTFSGLPSVKHTPTGPPTLFMSLPAPSNV